MNKYANNAFTQRFHDRALEADYREQIFLSSLVLGRWSLFGSILLHGILMVVDAQVLDPLVTGGFLRHQYLRLYIVIPISVAVFLASYQQKLQPVTSHLFCTITILNGAFMMSGTLIYGAEMALYWATGTVIVTIFATMLMGLRFTLTLIAIWATVMMQLIAISHTSLDQISLSTAIQAIVSSAVLLTIGSYFSERNNRVSFIRSKKILIAEKLHIKTEQSRLTWLEQIADFLRHELRNAMNGARTSLELINRSGEIDSAKIYVERGNKSIKNMSDLLNSVSDATSLESSFYKERSYRLNLTEVMGDYFSSLCHSDYATHMSEAEPFYIIAREERIVQMLDKIVDNALEHNDGSELVKVEFSHNTREAVVEVSNRGKPLPDNKEQMFDLFASFRETTKTNHKRGYGLYIARLIVGHYNGTIEAIDLNRPTGAKFVITLPAASVTN